MNLIQQKAAYILEKETHKIIKKSGDVISFNMERILSYIHEKNLNGIQPTHTEIGKVLRLTRPTVKRNVSRLISNKYIVAHADGRAKRLEITHKGKVELENRVY
jgi:DNA-binding MarR family transcriptional regulator